MKIWGMKRYLSTILLWGKSNVDALLENTEKVLQTINLAEYESIVFVAKSIGTVVACKLKEKYQIPALLILFTPIDETLPYIHKKNDILLFFIMY